MSWPLEKTVIDMNALFRLVIHLVLVFVGLMGMGWLLSAYAAPWLVWLGSGAVILYLSWIGPDAIALSLIWVIAVVWGAIISKVWPAVWPEIMFGTPAQTWSLISLLIWIFAVFLILLLAFAQQKLCSIGYSRRFAFYTLLFTSGLALGLGRLIFNAV